MIDTLDKGFLPQSASANVAIILNELSETKGLLLTAETVFMLAASGVSSHNIARMFRKSFNHLSENQHLQEAFEQGRASAGARMRTTLMDAALEGGNIQSAIYLDKILTQDQVATEVNINVAQSQLSTVSDDDLMKVAFTVDDGAESFDEDTVDETLDETLLPSLDTVEKPEGGGHTPEE